MFQLSIFSVLWRGKPVYPGLIHVVMVTVGICLVTSVCTHWKPATVYHQVLYISMICSESNIKIRSDP